MSDVSVSVFTGRIAHDPELKTTTNGKSVCTFSIAVEKGYGENKKVVYPTIVAWNGQAEFVSKLRKGTKIAVTAEYDERSWETRNGDKRKAYEFVASKITAMEPKQHSANSLVVSEFAEIEPPNDDELPF